MYYLKHKNETIALVDDSLTVTEVFNSKLMSLCLRKGCALDDWIESRTIDTTRYSSRSLRKLLAEDYSVLSNRLLSITDNWWLTNKENAVYSKNYNQGLAEITIQGIRSGTPCFSLEKDYCELGTTGSFEKCWKKLNGSWYLFKFNNSSEEFSEVYSSIVLRELGFGVVKYSVARIKTELGLTNTIFYGT